MPQFAITISGFVLSLQFSHDFSFLQKKNIPIPSIDNIRKERNIFFMTDDFK